MNKITQSQGLRSSNLHVLDPGEGRFDGSDDDLVRNELPDHLIELIVTLQIQQNLPPICSE